MRIFDFYCHQGHQYEFFKTGHDFYLSGVDSLKPDWNKDHRPLPSNVTLIDERKAHSIKFDVVIVRSALNVKRYNRFIKRGAIPIAVVQTTDPFKVPPEVKHIVWNSIETMNARKSFYPSGIKHHYIVHGFDPSEFKPMPEIEKNGRILTIANVFKKRNMFLDYNTFHRVNSKLGVCDVLGHGNEDIPESIDQANTFEELVRYHNTYNIYLNTTVRSAMPRSRAEAAMSGMPIISTNNYDIGRYFTDNKDIIFADNYRDMIKACKHLIDNPELQAKIGASARDTAIKHFHIDDYLAKWNEILWNL